MPEKDDLLYRSFPISENSWSLGKFLSQAQFRSLVTYALKISMKVKRRKEEKKTFKAILTLIKDLLGKGSGLFLGWAVNIEAKFFTEGNSLGISSIKAAVFWPIGAASWFIGPIGTLAFSFVIVVSEEDEQSSDEDRLFSLADNDVLKAVIGSLLLLLLDKSCMDRRGLTFTKEGLEDDSWFLPALLIKFRIRSATLPFPAQRKMLIVRKTRERLLDTRNISAFNG